MSTDLIPPHGGELINRLATAEEKKENPAGGGQSVSPPYRRSSEEQTCRLTRRSIQVPFLNFSFCSPELNLPVVRHGPVEIPVTLSNKTGMRT